MLHASPSVFLSDGTDLIYLATQTWDLTFLTRWIQVHAEDAAAMGKPLLIEEFGKQVCTTRLAQLPG